MAKEREFPFEFEERKEVLFFPEKPPVFSGDILEVGPGNGDLLLQLAAQHPDKKFVAIEKAKKRYFKISNRVLKRDLTNILLIQGDARVVLPKHFEEGTFETAYILFSDPWPKERHAFHRLLSLEFLWIVTHLIKKGGSLVIATDHEPYAQWILSLLKQIHSLENALSPQDYAPKLPELPTTYFEEKWRTLGKECYFMKYRKI